MNIPHTGYISREAMVAGLSSATGLQKPFILVSIFLDLNLALIALADPGQPPSPLTRVAFLLSLIFRSMALTNTQKTFHNSTEFIDRIETFSSIPKKLSQFFSSQKQAYVTLYLFETTDTALTFSIPCTVSEWQLSSLAELLQRTLISPLLLSCMKRLDILDYGNSPRLQRDDRDAQRIVQALRTLTGERASEVLPVLENIFVEYWQSEAVLGRLSPHENSPVTLWSSTVGSEGDNMTGDVSSYQLLPLSASIHAVLCPSILRSPLPMISSFAHRIRSMCLTNDPLTIISAVL